MGSSPRARPDERFRSDDVAVTDTLVPYAPPDRWVRLDGALNFRDLGGYLTGSGARVRWGRVFRSDSLDHLSDRDRVRLGHELGLGTVIDLRCAEERTSRVALPAAVVQLPMLDRSPIDPAFVPGVALHDVYLDLLRTHQDWIQRVVTAVAECEAPLVFHCGTGKDRAGLISAVLLGALGVGDADIARDYALSARVLPKILEARRRHKAGPSGWAPALPPEVHVAEASTMRTVLRSIRDAHGSMLGYALDIGVSPDSIATLRDRVLD